MGASNRDLVTVGRALTSLRERAGISAGALASQLHLEPAFVSAVEQGTLDLRWQTVMRILRALDADLTELADIVDALSAE